MSDWLCFSAGGADWHRLVHSISFNCAFHFHLRILQVDLMGTNSLPEMRIAIPDIY